MKLFETALMFFLVANPIGNTPAILALVKDFTFKRQKEIMLREGVIAFIIALFFLFFGEYFLRFLRIDSYSLTLCGGTLLFLTSLQMIFSLSHSNEVGLLKKEPMIVPIATPLLTGPGLMTIIMVSAANDTNILHITLSLLIAWVGILAVLAAGPYLQRILGKRGLIALEQIMGMVLALIAIEMLLSGLGSFIKQLH